MTDEYDDEDIILSELPNDELVEQMHIGPDVEGEY